MPSLDSLRELAAHGEGLTKARRLGDIHGQMARVGTLSGAEMPGLAFAACWFGMSCSGVVTTEPVSFLPDRATRTSPVKAPSPHIESVEARDRLLIMRGHDVATAVVESRVFSDTLARINRLAEGSPGTITTGSAVETIYSRGLEICYRVARRCGSTTAETGFGRCEGVDDAAIVTLFDATLVRLARTDREARACAVNTLAHEWSHAHPRTGGGSQFTDDEHESSSTPLVSYTIGALAQCVYLREEYLADDGNQRALFALERCVAEVGTNHFAAASCEPGWGQQFVRGGAEETLW